MRPGEELDPWLIMSIGVPRRVQGRSQDFSKGGGGCHTVSNIIVMAFSQRNIVGCFLKKGLQRGGGGTGTPGPPHHALGVSNPDPV